MSRLYFLFICYLTALTCYAQNSSFPGIAHRLNHADTIMRFNPAGISTPLFALCHSHERGGALFLPQ